MTGIEVTPAQRAAMRASWARVRARWDAVMARAKATGEMSASDQATLRQLADEHNQRLLQILTAEQRERLERNLAELQRWSATRHAPADSLDANDRRLP